MNGKILVIAALLSSALVGAQEAASVKEPEMYIEQTLFYDEKADVDDLEEELYCDSLELLAICVMAEAGSEDLDGCRMVADVILNRVDDPDFPDTIEGVITQPYQFSSYWDGGMERHNVPSEKVYRACQTELREQSYPGLLFFQEGSYSPYGTPAFKHGGHYFSTR